MDRGPGVGWGGARVKCLLLESARYSVTFYLIENEHETHGLGGWSGCGERAGADDAFPLFILLKYKRKRKKQTKKKYFINKSLRWNSKLALQARVSHALSDTRAHATQIEEGAP